MYPYGAPSVKCAICNYITTTTANTVASTPSARPTSNGSSYSASSSSAPKSQPQNVTVVVENPMTVDEKGKLVSNVAVGVTAGKKITCYHLVVHHRCVFYTRSWIYHVVQCYALIVAWLSLKNKDHKGNHVVTVFGVLERKP
uniref:Zinc finger LSD1-type domain-containing protein n=1 Tax=Arundo donax TaxID=35708 RepID=A0A0A9E7F9_ARUDO